MPNAAELDKELVDGLKAAKSKRAYFALVLKGSNDGALIVSKTKVPPTAIADAKKASGGSAVVRGFCQYEDGKYVFETAKDAPATAAQAVKVIAKRDAGLAVHAEFRVSNDPELLAGEGDAPAAPGATAKPAATATAPTKPTAKPQENGAAATTVATPDAARVEALKLRRGTSMEWLKTLKADPAKAPVVQKLAPIVAQCDEALKSGNLDEAEKKLVLLEGYQKLGPAAGGKTPETASENTPDATANEAKAAELRTRRGVIMEWLKEVKADPAKAPVVQKLAPILQQFDQVLKASDLGEAEKKIVLLENYRNISVAAGEKAKESAVSPEAAASSPAPSPEAPVAKPAVDPAVALREHEANAIKLDTQVKELQAQILKIDYDKLLGEFQNQSVNEIDAALFRQSREALDVLAASNAEYLKATVAQGKNDPAGIAKKWKEQVEANEKAKDEIERKREVLRQMQDAQSTAGQDENAEPQQNGPGEEEVRQTLAAAEIELAAAQGGKEYYTNLQNFGGIINTASAESPEIGGADVMVTFETAKQQAEDEDWGKANKSLMNAVRKAQLVMKRKPFLTLKLAEEPKIKAAIKIKVFKPNTNVKYGDEVDVRWKAILELAKAGNYDGAARETTQLVATIDREITPALAGAREANAAKLVELKQGLVQQKDNPEKLREIAIAIFKNTGEAEDIGIDPGENARKPFTDETVGANAWNVGTCEQAFKAYDWFALKKCRKVGTIELVKGTPLTFSDDDMWKLVQFRGKVVNGEIDKLRKIYPTLIAKASGSEDIESDIDITFAAPGSGDDVKAAKAFNKAIIGRFGKPAGRVFDVNIYPRDYGAIKESFKPDYNVDELVDENIDEPDQAASQKLSKIDQDVATLLKQRRFMEEDQFNEMLQTLMDQSPDKTVKDRIEKQYEEGEDIYLQTSLEKVAKIRAKVNLTQALPDERADEHRVTLIAELKKLDKLKGTGGKENLKLAQQLLPEILDLFEETFQAESMDVTDELYLDKMESLRADQETIRTKKGEIKAAKGEPKAHPGKTCTEAGHPECDWQKKMNVLESETNALEVKVKKDIFTNIIFANEAIMSQGALKHVVQALQAKTTEEKLEKLEKLTAGDLMQSVNEQVADLFKEMKHYDGVVEEAEDAAPAEGKASAKNRANGEGYVHASKYFFRLLDAAISLNLKYPKEESIQAPYEAVKCKGDLPLAKLKTQVDDVLLKLRKSAVIPPEVKGEVGALEMQELFPQVTDIATFRTMISDFAIELNRRIRALPEFKQSQEMDTDDELKAQQAYGKVAETERDKAMGRIRALASKPGDGPANLEETLAKLDVAPPAAAGLAEAWRAALAEQLPRDLTNLRSKVRAISNTEAADELQAIVGWFEQANAMHALSQNQETQAVAAEIEKARVSITNAETLIGRVHTLSNEAKKERRNLTADEKQPLLADIGRMKNEITGAQTNVRNATPQGAAEPLLTMIAEIMGDLQRNHDNLDRRAVELNKV